MKIKEIREKSEKELQSLLAEKRERLRHIRFDSAANKKVKNSKEINQIRKDIARILTILNSNKPKNTDENLNNEKTITKTKDKDGK